MKKMVYYIDDEVCLTCGHNLIKDINQKDNKSYTERYYCSNCNTVYRSYYHKSSDNRIRVSADVERRSDKFIQEF